MADSNYDITTSHSYMTVYNNYLSDARRREERSLEDFDLNYDQLSIIKAVLRYVELLMDNKSISINNRDKAVYWRTLMRILKGCSEKYNQTIKKRKYTKEYFMSHAESFNEKIIVKKEIWIHPVGFEHTHRVSSVALSKNDVAEEELSNLSQLEITKRFIMSYLCVQRILLTNIDVNQFQETVVQMLREFRKLLSFNPLPNLMKDLSYYLALNILVIDNNKDDVIENSRSPQYDLELVYANTITMAWGMMRLIIDKCNYLIKEKMVNDNGDKFNLSGGDIEVLMYPIRIWCDWLIDNPEVLRSDSNNAGYIGVSYWSRLADFVNTLERVKIHYKLPQHVLPDRDSNQFLNTIYCILFFVTDYLCDPSKPIFMSQKTSFTSTNDYIPLIDRKCPIFMKKKFDTSTEFEVEPHYVVLDKSCFIDSLTEVKKIIHFFVISKVTSCYLLIPTFVLNDLENLVKEDEMKYSVAKEALQILKDANLAAIVKFVTKKGNIFDYKTLTDENIVMGHGDLNLLTTCLNLCKPNSRMTEEKRRAECKLSRSCLYYCHSQPFVLGTYFIYRDVILLTNNRNMKVNARSMNIPFRTTKNFLIWLNGNTN